MNVSRCVLSCTLVVSLCVLAAVAGEPGEKPLRLGADPVPHPGFYIEESIRADQFVVKLAKDAAEGAHRLPVLGLPEGIAELEALLVKHGIVDGRRVVQKRGTPIGNVELFKKVGLDRAYVLTVPEPHHPVKIRDLVREFAQQPWVEYAEPVYIAEPMLEPNDALFGDQWAHVNTGQNVNGSVGTPDADADSDLAWDLTTGAGGAVSVLDTGVDIDHPDLVGNLIPGYDFIDDDPNPDDVNGHGTGSCGIAAAVGNNGIGVSGICPECDLAALRVSTSVNEVDAIVWSADNGMDTYNMSHTFGFGASAWIQIIIDATEYATAQGSLGFASATNGSGYGIGTPASFPEVIPMGGSNNDDVRVYAYSDLTELTAPGPDTRSTWLGGSYTYFGGTSSSSPFGAGLGALVRSYRPNIHVRELRHLLRVSCDDEVGAPSEDTPGWDQFMGYGRVNAHTALLMADGPWIALDRPHYWCGGPLTVALKDPTAGASVDVTLTGDVGGDMETVTVFPVAGTDGYYEGTIDLSWAGNDGPVVLADGKLDVEHDENITATAGALSAEAFTACMKKVCQWTNLALDTTGDCDQDGALDPGEIWTISVGTVNLQTEELFDITTTLSTTNPDVMILKDTATYGSLPPQWGGHASVENAFRVQALPGAAANQVVDFDVVVSGLGFESDQTRCFNESGFGTGFSLPLNRDLGSVVQGWDFDDGTSMQFKAEKAHGIGGVPSGNVSECDGPVWENEWGGTPVTDRAHSGTFSMRLGSGTDYAAALDSGLKSPPFTVPASGGAVSFYMWMDAFISDSSRTWDGMIVEAKRTVDTTWTYLTDATYASKQIQTTCPGSGTRVPFGVVERIPMLAGDGTGTGEIGDEFDQQHLANVSQFAGEEIQVRFRFASHTFGDPATHGTGTWVDTVSVHDDFVQDAWPGTGPQNLLGSDAAGGRVDDRQHRNAAAEPDDALAARDAGQMIAERFQRAQRFWRPL
ncbi:MAG: S8 family serine peptidase, partial [Acidobacteriota bacterium]|nr:S8 family serine peptidase [Acidobacteriota bacterium]